MPVRPEDPVLTSSRREALVVLAIWTVACAYTVGYCAAFGYERDPQSLRFVAGVPDWVFWGIVVPWSVCTVLSFWVSNFLIKDQDLGEERAEVQLSPAPGGPLAPQTDTRLAEQAGDNKEAGHA